MYTLYFTPDACSLATQVVLTELDQPYELINAGEQEDFHSLNPVGAVPVLVENGQRYTEGAAIMLLLMDRHRGSRLFPASGEARAKAIEHLMFANATMHPAYSRLFFIANHCEDKTVQIQGYEGAAKAINQLWRVVEESLSSTRFLGGEYASIADIMLAVYARWGRHFPVDIHLGERTQKMLNAVYDMPSFQRSLARQNEVLRQVKPVSEGAKV